ncbi:hypothetical protein D3C80_2194280 [compost metagenome]
MDMIDFADLVVVGTVYGCTFENRRRQFRWIQANVSGVVHFVSSVRFVCKQRTVDWLVCSRALRWSCRNSSS